MSDREGSSPKFLDAPGSVLRYAKQLQKDFKLTWKAALIRARNTLQTSPMFVIFTATPTLLSVVFDSTVTLNGATVASYAWDYGDATANTTADPTHVYRAAGTYHVTLVVTDTDGLTSSFAMNVTVAAS